jgi:aspartate-semialdehyde dehydrogenase
VGLSPKKPGFFEKPGFSSPGELPGDLRNFWSSLVFGTVTLVGATGAVGRIMRDRLEARNFPAKKFRFLASKRSAGTTITFKGQPHVVEELTRQAFAGSDLVIASTPDDVAAEYLPAAVESGAKVIDESGYWRMKEGVALVIPEINPQDALNAKGIIASPNCSTTQLAMALKPLHDAARVKRVIVSTYQATSGAGVQGQEDLIEGSRAHLAGSKYQYKAFKHPIAFNCIPHIGGEKEAGYTSEEMKMVYETRKILGDQSILVCPTAVRVPVSNCHSESICVETERPLSVQQARELFANFPGIKVVDNLGEGQYPLPSTCDGSDEVFIGRIRKDLSSPNGLAFWCVSDNLRKGAATNAVQIAELLAKHRV